MCSRATLPSLSSSLRRHFLIGRRPLFEVWKLCQSYSFLGGLVSALSKPRPDEDSSPTLDQADLVDVQPEDDSEFSLHIQIDELSVHSFLLVLAQSVSPLPPPLGRLFSNLHLARRDIVLAASSLDVSTRTSLRSLPISKHALFGPVVQPSKIAPNDRDSLALKIPGP